MAKSLRLVFSSFVVQSLVLCAIGKDTKPNIVILFADDVSTHMGSAMTNLFLPVLILCTHLKVKVLF